MKGGKRFAIRLVVGDMIADAEKPAYRRYAAYPLVKR